MAKPGEAVGVLIEATNTRLPEYGVYDSKIVIDIPSVIAGQGLGAYLSVPAAINKAIQGARVMIEQELLEKLDHAGVGRGRFGAEVIEEGRQITDGSVPANPTARNSDSTEGDKRP